MAFARAKSSSWRRDLTAVAGIGWEATSSERTSIPCTIIGTSPIPTPTITPVVADRQFPHAAPELALLYKLNPEWLFRARVATGYGTPQVGNLFVLSNGQNGNNTQLNDATEPWLRLGFDWTPNNTLKFSATGFYEFFRNELVSQATQVVAPNQLHVQRPEIGTSRRRASRGLEILPRLAVHGRLHLSRRGLYGIHREPRQRRDVQLQPCRQQDPRHLAERTDGAAWL